MEIRCDRCGAPMSYDLTSRRMKCEYCGNEREAEENFIYPETAKNSCIEDNTDDTDNTDNADYATCSSCGANLMSQKNMMSQVCPYCNNVLVSVEDQNSVKPEAVIPFMVDKNGIEAALRFPISNNTLIPLDFKKVNRAEDLKEVFISIWLFELDTQAEFTGEYWDGKRLHRRKISHGHFEKYYDTIPVCATKDHGLNRMDICHAFRFSEYKTFSPEYLAGHPAELPEIDVEKALVIAKEMVTELMKEDIEKRMRSHYNAVEAKVTSLEIDFKEEEHICILAPMWGKDNFYDGKLYPTVVSGQTGVYFGTYPSSWANMGKGIIDLLKKK